MKFYMLDGNEKILCAVPSKDIISLYQNLNYHQADTIEGSLVLSEKYTSILNNVRYFAISDRESNHNFYLYRKTLVQVQNHEIAINGQGAFWDEMQGAYIKDKRPNQVTPADTIKLILGYSRWNVDYVDQMLEEESLRRDMNFYYVSLLDALNTVYQTWQVDIEPYINIEGHQITRRYVKLYQQQGGNNGRRFVYGDNALTVTQQANEGSIFTALVGRGAGVEETDASGNLTGGYSRKINFADIEWSKANGDPCDKPKGQEYVEWKESTELYGYSDGKPRIGIVNFDNEKDPAQLLKETWAQLQQVGVPLVQFQATVGDVGYLNLGETVTIVRYDLNIKYQTRVTGIKWNRCDEAKSQITIGVKAIQSTADKIAGLQQSVAQANVNADEAKSTANHAIIDGTGAVVNYGPNEPTNPKEGDIWYDVQPDGTVVLKQYQNGQWVILIDDTTGQQIKNKVEAQQKELDKAVQDANAASAKADGLVAQVGDANTNAQKALTTAQQNQADLAQAKNDLENTKSQLTNVQSDLTGTKSSLAGAISNISQAQEDLKNTEQSLQGVKSDLANTKQSLANDEKNLTSLSEQAKAQEQTIVDIQKTQSGLSADVADVKGNVSSLQDTADGLQATVGTLNSDNLLYNSDFMANTPGKVPNTDWLPVPGWLSLNNTAVQRCLWFNQNALQVGWINANGGFYTKAVKSNTPDPKNANATTAYDLSFLIMSHPGTYDVYIEASYTEDFSDPKQIKLGTINQCQNWTPQEYSFTVSDVYPWLRLKMVSEQDKGLFYLAQPMLVYGSKKPSSYISSNQPSQKIASISETVDGIKTTVSDNTNGISQIKQTAQSIQSDVANNKNDISSIKQTADSLKSSIQDDEKNISSLQQTAQGLQGSISDNKNDIANIKATAQGLQTSVQDNKKNISTIQQQAGTIESAISTVNSDNLIYNSDFLTTEPGISPLTNWEPADGWNSINTAVQRCMWYGYSALQVGWINANAGMYTRAIKANQPNTSDASAKTQYNLSFLIRTSAGTYDVYIDCSYDDTFNNSTPVKVDTITQIYSNWTKLNWTVELPSIYPWIRLRIISEQDKGLFYLAQPMLVYGSDTPSKYISSNQPGQKMSSIKQTIDSIQSTVQSNTGQISQVKQTADSLQSAVTNNSNDISTLKQTATGLQSTVSNIKASSENLLPDTLDFAGWQQGGQGNMDSAQADNTLTNAWHAWGDNNSAWIGSPQAKPVYLRAGTQYTFSAVCWNNGSLTGNNFDDDDVELYFNNNDNSRAYNHQLTSKTNKEHVRYSVTFTVDTDGLYWGFKLIDKSGFVGGSLWSAEYMLVEGNIATAYQPSSTAMATNISTIQQTIDGVKIDVANSKGDISSLKQRADSMESNISDNKNDISDLRQTANSLQSNIQSKADISQITQLSNAIQSVVQSVGSFFPNGDFADSNIQAYWSPWDVTKDYTNINFDAATYNGSFGNLLLHASGGGWTKAISTEYIPVQPNKSVTVSLASRGDWYGSNGKPQTLQCYVHFYDSKKNETENGHFDLNCSNNQQWYDNSVTYDCNSNECYIRVEICLQGNQENWAHITNVKVSSDGGESISSKISQMTDDINMRVQKGDLLSQINIQAGSTLIQSNKLYLDASSVVFSGNAFIPSAAITDLSADKITAGTLNAYKVNVINLDVNKLVGDTTEFVRSGWTNAYGSHVQIDGGGMTVNYGNWYTRFDGNGMTFKDGSDNLGGFTRIGMTGAPDWYNGLAFNAGGDAEFLSIGAQDYGNDNQNPVPAKLLWMRSFDDKNRYGYQPGWNFCDTVWADDLKLNHIGTSSYRLDLVALSMNGETAFGLQSGNGYGFWWGANGGLGIYGGGKYVNFTHTKFINDIQMGQGGSINWGSL